LLRGNKKRLWIIHVKMYGFKRKGYIVVLNSISIFGNYAIVKYNPEGRKRIFSCCGIVYE